MNSIKTLALTALAALAGFQLIAVDFDGTGAWPTSGDVRIVADVNVDDAHAADVAGWDTVFITSGNTLAFVNTGAAVTFKAACSGSGKLMAADSCGLTITGDNSGLAGNWVISNSCVYVNHEKGLGGASTDAAQIYFGDAKSAIHFDNPGSNYFTNSVAIVYDSPVDMNYRGCVFGSESPEKYFVQNADFWQKTSNPNKRPTFTNNFESINGWFPYSVTKSGSGNHFYVNFAAGSRVVTTQNSKFCLQRGFYSVGGSGTLVLDSAAPQLNTSYGAFIKAPHVNFVLGRSGALGSVLPNYQVYLDSNPLGVFDLNGINLLVSVVNCVYGQTCSESTKTYSRFTSATPATLEVNGYYVAEDTVKAEAVPLKFEGQSGLAVSSEKINLALATVVSDTTGDLSVSAGTLELKWNAGWGGASGNVTVSGTGVLDVNSPHAFEGNKKDLVISGSGRMILRTGATASFKSVRLGSTTLEKRVYTIAELKANEATAPYVDGDDAAVVAAGIETWEGWPTSPEAQTVVPINTAVTLADADVANVAANVSKLVLRPGAQVTIQNETAPLTLTAEVSGTGQIRIIDSVGVTLLGDNSELASPGAFYIENSAVAVSNRFGLGSWQTGAATVNFTTADRWLTFGLANSAYFTNEVALVIGQTVGGTAVASLGSNSTDEYLVLAGGVTFNTGTTFATRVTYRGNVEIASGEVTTTGNLFLYGALCAHLKFGPACILVNNAVTAAQYNFYGAGWNESMAAVPVVEFGPGYMQNIGSLMREVTYLKIQTTDAFPSNSRLTYSPASLAQKGRGTFDLCGVNRTIGRLVKYDGAPTRGSSSITQLTSDSPAVLTLVTESEELVRDAVRFEGHAGYCYSGMGTNLLCNVASISDGPFTVTSGTAGLDWGATWAGNAITVSGGTLFIGADSAAAGAFGTESGARQSEAVLTLGALGKLDIEDGTVVVKKLIRAETPMNKGDYCSFENPVQDATPVTWITGAGVLRVLRNAAASGSVLIFQ